jgi:hypothetical protein
MFQQKKRKCVPGELMSLKQYERERVLEACDKEL